jgi:hypothetical protein
VKSWRSGAPSDTDDEISMADTGGNKYTEIRSPQVLNECST